jgi:hypothetical protein
MVEGRHAAAFCGDAVCLFNLSDPRSPTLRAELAMEHVELLALGRHRPGRKPDPAGAGETPLPPERVYLHTAGKDQTGGWPGKYVFQSADVTEPDSPEWLGSWEAQVQDPGMTDVGLEAVGDVAIFAASMAPTDGVTRVATWIADSTGVRRVLWQAIHAAALDMATTGQSLLLANGLYPNTWYEGWLSVYRVTASGELEFTDSNHPDSLIYQQVHTDVAADPNGMVYYVEGSHYDQLRAARVDELGRLLDAPAPVRLVSGGCGFPGSPLIPIPGALVAACRGDGSLRIHPTTYSEPPVLLGRWLDRSRHRSGHAP